jgi:NAD(P)-dependent dehydrogenase (short-subunit alcohol dehydrogenase family)
MNNRVWFITGTSQGFGNELVRAVLQHGDSVVATSRQPKKVADAFKEGSDRLLAISRTRSQSAISAGVKIAV